MTQINVRLLTVTIRTKNFHAQSSIDFSNDQLLIHLFRGRISGRRKNISIRGWLRQLRVFLPFTEGSHAKLPMCILLRHLQVVFAKLPHLAQRRFPLLIMGIHIPTNFRQRFRHDLFRALGCDSLEHIQFLRERNIFTF